MKAEQEQDINSIFRSLTRLPEHEEQKFLNNAVEKNMKKGDLFIRAGQIPDKIAFVRKGLFRYFYADRKGNEFTKSFFAEGSFITSYSAMRSETPSWYSIEALEDSKIMVVTYDKWLTLRNGHPGWSELLIAMLEKGYAKKEARERQFLLCDAAERFNIFLNEYPHLYGRIRQHMIASYLGITPVALSRIKKSYPALT